MQEVARESTHRKKIQISFGKKFIFSIYHRKKDSMDLDLLSVIVHLKKLNSLCAKVFSAIDFGASKCFVMELKCR